jgi:LPXTG-site transpeptidase (sortase) family protein
MHSMLVHMRISLRFANNILFGLIVLINCYIIAAPFAPRISYWWQSHHSQRQNQLSQAIHAKPSPHHQPNSLTIPSMMLSQATLEGPKSDWFTILKDGIWRWPDSSTPDKGGNTVFLAHRFSYTGPHGAFYYLDKLHPGDEIGVTWNDKLYVYKVTSSRVVPPTETSIEDNTNDARITLFTCTPLWHPVNRLVVVAELEKRS